MTRGSDAGMKNCAVINDISGFGKCSLTAALPVLNALGTEVNPVVTAVLTNQTGYYSYYMDDLGNYMLRLIDEWKKLSVGFDGILSGFIGSLNQFEYVNAFFDEFGGNDTLIVVDPVMADNGSRYDNYSKQMCSKVKELCRRANVITPNATELSILCGAEYSNDIKTVTEYAESLITDTLKCVIVTGVIGSGLMSNVCVCSDGIKVFSSPYVEKSFSGTGDLFASVITGCLLKGISPFCAVETAQNFIAKSISVTSERDSRDGICFEKYLGMLTSL